MVPIAFQHAPTPVKPSKNATADQHKAYREALRQQNLNRETLELLATLREETPAARHLIITGDGSYTNKTVLRGKPGGSTYIGRGRKDMVLHHLPETVAGANGRPRRYGIQAPTPDQLRQDESVPWQTVEAFAAGKRHEFRIKTIGPVLWRKAGADLPVRVVVIAPLGYRLRKGSRMLYRQPAYLICTDPELPLEKLVQYYLWRWGVEVNFREEKTLIGTGEAQVRTAESNQHLPAITVAAYALLWTVALQVLAAGTTFRGLRPPKWRRDRSSEGKLPSTGDLLRLLRYEIWAGVLRPGTFYHFVTDSVPAIRRMPAATAARSTRRRATERLTRHARPVSFAGCRAGANQDSPGWFRPFVFDQALHELSDLRKLRVDVGLDSAFCRQTREHRLPEVGRGGQFFRQLVRPPAGEGVADVARQPCGVHRCRIDEQHQIDQVLHPRIRPLPAWHGEGVQFLGEVFFAGN